MGGPRYLDDLGALKALAHPLRQRLLTRLHSIGPATSAMLAVEFAEDRGAMSYHLRQLERFGFVEPDPNLSAGRRKFWRAVSQDVRLPLGKVGPAARAAAGAIERHWRARAERELASFRADPQRYGEFADASMSSQSRTNLTAGELAAFAEEYIALLDRWRRAPEEASPEARPVTIVFNAFPTPDDVS